VFLATGGADEVQVSASANVGYDLDDDGTADTLPFNLTLSGFGREFAIVDGRALIDLDFTADLLDGGNADQKLTMTEVISNVGPAVLTEFFL